MGTTQETRERTEPATETSTNPYSTYPPSETRFIEAMKKSVSQYRQSIEYYQQDWIRSSKNNFDLIESVQREFTEKSDATIAMIDAATRIISALNENAKAFAELNHTITQIWISPWSPKSD
jgi:hypothetical protein